MIISKSINTSDCELTNLANKFLIGDVSSIDVSEPMFGIEKIVINYKNYNDLNSDLKYLGLIKNDYTELEQSWIIRIEHISESDIKFICSKLECLNKIFKDMGLFEIDGVEGDGYGSIVLFGNCASIEEDILKSMNREEILKTTRELIHE